MREPKSVADLLSYQLLRLSNTLALYSSRRYRDQFGVTLPEWRVLSIVAARGTTTAREISRVLATDKGWVGLSVESLRRRKLVETSSDEADSRKILLNLSKEGRALHGAIVAIARQRQRRLLATIPKNAAATLVASLTRLQEEADRMLDELEAASGRAVMKSARVKGRRRTSALRTPKRARTTQGAKA
jgi:DNA-binding MarR family transcriptional regulator